MYEAITKYIGKLADWGEKYIPSESSCHIPVVSYTQATDDFRKDMRAFMPKDYIAELDKIKTKLNIEQFRTDLDISTLTAEEIIALITGVIRRERFCEGILGTFIKEGAIDKWLVRLKELDEKGTSAMSEKKLTKEVIEKIDYTIKQIWIEEIKNDYFSHNCLKEDSLKCCFYYHLRNKLGYLLNEYNLKIYSEYYFNDLSYRADLAIVRIDPNSEEEYLADWVTDVVAIIELKFDSSSSKRTAEWIKNDVYKIKDYIQRGGQNCQFYFAVVYEVECSALNWLDKRQTNNWANGYVTELDAGYIDGEMTFEVNSYNNLNN